MLVYGFVRDQAHQGLIDELFAGNNLQIDYFPEYCVQVDTFFFTRDRLFASSLEKYKSPHLRFISQFF